MKVLFHLKYWNICNIITLDYWKTTISSDINDISCKDYLMKSNKVLINNWISQVYSKRLLYSFDYLIVCNDQM